MSQDTHAIHRTTILLIVKRSRMGDYHVICLWCFTTLWTVDLVWTKVISDVEGSKGRHDSRAPLPYSSALTR